MNLDNCESQRAGRERGAEPSNPAPAGEAPDPWIGRRIGETYEVTRFIGSGAVGRVYEADSRNISRKFAIKIVDPGDDSIVDTNKDNLRARIEREIEAQSKLRNPHVVQLFDVVELPQDKLAIVMDLVCGETIRELVNRCGPLPPQRACDILRQAANGVHEAHELGLVHRDLKPANLMVEVLPAGDDFVRVFDFGIVCLQNHADEVEGFVGTPLFASPEQARGDKVGRQSDIYSLGIVLFYMLTGRTPFEAERSFQVLMAHCEKKPPALAEALPGGTFSDELEALVARLLAKHPQERPSTLSQVITELDALPFGIYESLPTAASQSSLGMRESAATVVPEDAERLESPAAADCLADGPAPAAQVVLPRGVPPKRQLVRPQQTNRRCAGAASRQLIRRTQEDYALTVRETSVPASMAGCPWTITPDGRVVYLGKNGSLYLHDVRLGAHWSVDLGIDEPAISLAIAKGAAFIGTLDGRVLHYSFASDELTSIYQSPYGVGVDSLATDRLARWLVLSNSNGEVRCANIDGHTNPAWRRVQSHAARVKVNVANDGERFAMLTGASRLLVHTTDWPHSLVADVDLGTPLHCVRLSKSGARVAALTQSWQLGVWRLPDGKPLSPLRPLDNVLSIAFANDDELMLLRPD